MAQLTDVEKLKSLDKANKNEAHVKKDTSDFSSSQLRIKNNELAQWEITDDVRYQITFVMDDIFKGMLDLIKALNNTELIDYYANAKIKYLFDTTDTEQTS